MPLLQEEIFFRVVDSVRPSEPGPTDWAPIRQAVNAELEAKNVPTLDDNKMKTLEQRWRRRTDVNNDRWTHDVFKPNVNKTLVELRDCLLRYLNSATDKFDHLLSPQEAQEVVQRTQVVSAILALVEQVVPVP